MTNDDTQKKEQHPTENPNPTVSAPDGETEHGIHKGASHNHGTKNSHKKKNIFRRIIDKENQSVIANIVSIGLLVATIALAVFTVGLFKKTSIQADNAIKSANAAVTADSIAKISLDSQISAKKQSDATDAKKLGRDTVFINKQKQGIDFQIASLIEARDEFEVSNKAYIQANKFSFSKADTHLYLIQFIIENVGNQPVKILYGHIDFYDMQMKLNSYKEVIDSSFHRNTRININYYLVKGNPESVIKDIDVISKPMVEQGLEQKIYNHYVYGDLFYKNLVTLKMGEYIFAVEIPKDYRPDQGYITIRSDNK